MKVKELIKRLKEVVELNPESNVFLWDNENYPVDFSHFGCDDNCDVELAIASGDKRV